MYKCPKCGSMSNHGKFCRYCGAKLNERILTFENTNTLLRSNVVIKDNIVDHEDDVMDETKRNLPLEIHDKIKDSSINNNIYSFSSDSNKDHCEDYDGISFRDESNASHPESVVNEENRENFSESSFIDDDINNEDIDYSNTGKDSSLDFFSMEDVDESIITAEMEDVDESFERSSNVFMPLSEQRKKISNTQDLLNRDIAIDSESKNQENEPFDTNEEMEEEVQEFNVDTNGEESSLVLSENETLETEKHTSSNYCADESVSEPFVARQQTEEEVKGFNTDTNDEEPSLVLSENETLETEKHTLSNYYADESVSEPFDTNEEMEEEVQEFNVDTNGEESSLVLSENETLETEKHTSSNYCADESVSEPFVARQQTEEEVKGFNTDTNDEEPSLVLSENETLEIEKHTLSNYYADESVSEPFVAREQTEEEVQGFNVDTNDEELSSVFDKNETGDATGKKPNPPLDATEKNQFSNFSDRNSGNNIPEKEDSIVVSSGKGYIDSMFGELPTFDTELIKKNYEQSIINRNKTEKKKHKFFGKKKTE